MTDADYSAILQIAGAISVAVPAIIRTLNKHETLVGKVISRLLPDISGAIRDFLEVYREHKKPKVDK